MSPTYLRLSIEPPQVCLEKDNKNNIYGYLISIYKI